MQIVPLIGRKLKSDEIIEFLEGWDVDVVYAFDRLHENDPDTYYATIKEVGIDLVFDSTQTLTTIFLHIDGSEERVAFNLQLSDVPAFETFEAARILAESHGLSTSQGSTTFLGKSRKWIKLGYASYSVHYEFVDSELKMVTVALLTSDE